MQILRLLVSFVALISVLFATFLYIESRSNLDGPTIVCSQGDTLEVSSKVTDQELLALVKASDKRDGDLTDKIVVERKMYFVAEGVSQVTYSVCDSDNNVAKLQRKVHFTDYTPPRIRLNNDLIVVKGNAIDLSACFTVEDCFGENINNRLKIISTEYNNLAAGTYPINCKVSNVMGDTRDITLSVIVTDHAYSGYGITLNQYLDYLPVGTQPDFISYIKNAYSENSGDIQPQFVTIDDSEFKSDTAGTYNIYYTIERGGKTVAMTRLIVITEAV